MKVITLLILFLFSASSWTQNITLTAVSEVWPQFANPEDDKQGFIIEVAREAFKSQGYDLVVNFVPWTRALDNMRNDKADILIAAWYSAERNSYLYFSQPIVQSPVRFLKRKEDPFEFKDLDSLTGLRIGTILNYQYQEEFLQATNFDRITSHSLINNVQHLIAGRIELTLDDQYVSRHVLNKHFPNWQESISFVNKPLTLKKIFLASGRSNKHHETIINAFNKGLAILKKNGRYEEILSNYDFIERFSSSSS